MRFYSVVGRRARQQERKTNLQMFGDGRQACSEAKRTSAFVPSAEQQRAGEYFDMDGHIALAPINGPPPGLVTVLSAPTCRMGRVSWGFVACCDRVALRAFSLHATLHSSLCLKINQNQRESRLALGALGPSSCLRPTPVYFRRSRSRKVQLGQLAGEVCTCSGTFGLHTSALNAFCVCPTITEKFKPLSALSYARAWGCV